MGGGKSSAPQSSQPAPPPTPTPEVDVATSAAEKALAASSKASYASTVEDDTTGAGGTSKKSSANQTNLGVTSAQTQPSQQPMQPRRRERAPGSMMGGSQGMGASAVVTG